MDNQNELALLEQLRNNPSLISKLGISSDTISQLNDNSLPSEAKKRKSTDKVTLALNPKRLNFPALSLQPKARFLTPGHPN